MPSRLRRSARSNKKLDGQLTSFAERRLQEEYPYLVLDARYERVREDGVIRKRAVLIAIGINWEGRRCVLAVDLANRETASSWKAFLLGLRDRGLRGVEVVVSDDHSGLKRAIAEVLPEAAGSAATCISCAMPGITCPERPMTTVCRSCVGSMTAVMWRKPAGIWRPGLRSGRRSTRSCVTGPRSASRRPGPSIVSRSSITNT